MNTDLSPHPRPPAPAASKQPTVRRGLRAVLQVALGAVLAFTITSPLLAAPSAAERETARRLMEEGDDLAEKGELHSAMSRFRSAHALVRVPTTGVSLAKVQAKLGLLVEARATAIEVTNMPVAPSEPAVFTEAREKAIALTNEIEPRVPSLTTTVSPNSASYTISVDGVALPAAARSGPYRTNPGVHSLRVDAPGYLSETLQVELAEGQAQSAAVQLKLVSPEIAAATSRDGVAPVSGDHAGPGRTRGIIGVSAGGAVFVFGVVSGIVAASKFGSLKDDCPNNACSPDHKGRLSSANTFANLANVMIPLGLLGAGYGVYELLTLPQRGTEHARSPQLQLAVSHNAIFVGGTL